MADARGKFFGGRSATFEDVTLRLEDGHLLIIAADQRILGRWPRDQIFRDGTHMVAAVIACGGDDERIEVLDLQILDDLKIHRGFWNLSHIMQSKRAIVAWALGSVTIIGLLLWNSGAITRFVVGKISLEREKALGDMVVSQQKWKPCPLNTEQQAAADEVLALLFKTDPDKRKMINLNWVDDPMVNAFALPGGSIYFFKGLMEDLRSAEEFAGILAHEIEHIERRHVMESLVKGVLTTALFNFVFGDFSALVLIDPATAAQIVSLRLSREMERQADEGALARLQAAGISPRGTVDFFARLSEKEHFSEHLSFLSTHPFTEKRARFFESAIPKDDNPFESFLAGKKWKALLSICSKN